MNDNDRPRQKAYFGIFTGLKPVPTHQTLTRIHVERTSAWRRWGWKLLATLAFLAGFALYAFLTYELWKSLKGPV